MDLGKLKVVVSSGLGLFVIGDYEFDLLKMNLVLWN